MMPPVEAMRSRRSRLSCKQPALYELVEEVCSGRQPGRSGPYLWLVAKVVQMTCCYKAIASIVARSTNDEHPPVRAGRILAGQRCCTGQSSKLHELVDGKAEWSHQLLINLL